MESPPILFDLTDHVATVTLNRPEKLNAFTGEMRDLFFGILERIDEDDDVRAVVVTGSGRGFCSGADLSRGGGTFDTSDREPGAVHRDGSGRLALRLLDCTKPMIAAINGPAVGVGLTMTLPMDIRLASTAAKFGLVFARRGITPDACSSWFLPRIVGISRAMEWVATGRTFSAEEAAAHGLVRSLHDPDRLLPAAYDLAHEIADNAAPVSVALSRQLMWRMLWGQPIDANRAESRALTARGQSADAREGIRAFLEKRAPAFSDSPAQQLPDIWPDWQTPSFD